MAFNSILVDVANGIGTITLNRPKTLNAFHDEMIHETTAVFKQFGRDDNVRCVVITGNGRAFSSGQDLSEKIGLIPILRAGLGMVDGIWEMMPGAEVWHIGLYRDEETLQPVSYYNKLPTFPTVQVCLVLDPMLATGGSAIATVDILKKWGAQRIKFMGLLAAPEGIAALQKAHPDVPIHIAQIDSHLNDIGFIVPGLGDAGDRQFGTA